MKKPSLKFLLVLAAIALGTASLAQAARRCITSTPPPATGTADKPVVSPP